MYTICSLFAICSILKSTLSLWTEAQYGAKAGGAEQTGRTGKNAKKQTPRREARRKSWEVSQREATYLYRIYARDPAPTANYFVAWAGHPAVNHKKGCAARRYQQQVHRSLSRSSKRCRSRPHSVARRSHLSTHFEITEITRPRLQGALSTAGLFFTAARLSSAEKACTRSAADAAANFLGAPKK
jgi:hypothetical protein